MVQASSFVYLDACLMLRSGVEFRKCSVRVYDTLHTQAQEYLQIYVCAHVLLTNIIVAHDNACTCVCVHIYLFGHICTSMFICMHMYTICMNIYICTYVYVGMYVCMHACILCINRYVGMHVCIYIYVYIHVHMCVFMHTHISVCLCKHTDDCSMGHSCSTLSQLICRMALCDCSAVIQHRSL